MTKSRTKAMLLACLSAVLLAQLALGQTALVLRAKVPFGFTAGGKNFAAGSYTFTRGKGINMIVLSSADGKSSINLPVITSLARSSPADDHLLAFDKVGDGNVLSEVWLPGQDGMLVHSTPGEHKHEVVRLVAERAKR
jgi:hypothetical protein